MTKKLSYQVIEDNAGGLHLAVFGGCGDECIWYTSGLEHLPGTDVQEMLQALRDGADPVQDGWEADLPEGYTPQLLYDELTGYDPATWRIIADDAGVYPERMGTAGRMALKTKDNNTDHWGRCFWCNTISHEAMIEYDDNGEPICPKCKRAGAMVKL